MSDSILVAGCGSIGRRHIRNLHRLGVDEVLAWDTDPERLRETADESAAQPVESYDAGLAATPRAVLVCTPPHLHVQASTAAVRAGAHVLIEKPLSNTLEGVDELLNLTARRGLVTMAGYNLRFHAGLRKVKDLLESGIAGRVLTVRAEYGQYLPTWRPERDYREGYITRASTGGGIILDSSHELDYVAWLGGQIESVYAVAERLSDLDMETEDVALMVLRLEGGVLGEIHVDCVQRGYSRECKVVGTEGSITWVFGEGVRLVRPDGEEFFEIAPEANEMYLEELKHFLACLDGSAVPPVDGVAARRVLELALAAKESARRSAEVRVG